MLRAIVLLLALGMAIVVLIALSRRARWEDASRDLRAKLVAHASTAGEQSSVPLEELPPPVRRYLELVLPTVQRPVVSVELEQEAEFFVPMGGGSWKPLRATQRFTTRPAGFVWDARIRMLPMVPVYVLDSYVEGTGATHASLGAMFSLANASGGGADSGALQRFLGEGVWFPTIYTSPAVTWRALDDNRAIATIVDGHTTVSLEFRFGDDGLVTEVYAPDRLRETNGRFEPTPWLVKCDDYQFHHGMRIPVWCEVSWLMPDGPAPYWRGRVTAIRYE